MANQYTAVIKQDGDWWLGWIEEIPGVNCQEPTRRELLETLRVTLAAQSVSKDTPWPLLLFSCSTAANRRGNAPAQNKLPPDGFPKGTALWPPEAFFLFSHSSPAAGGIPPSSLSLPHPPLTLTPLAARPRP